MAPVIIKEGSIMSKSSKVHNILSIQDIQKLKKSEYMYVDEPLADYIHHELYIEHREDYIPGSNSKGVNNGKY